MLDQLSQSTVFFNLNYTSMSIYFFFFLLKTLINRNGNKIKYSEVPELLSTFLCV